MVDVFDEEDLGGALNPRRFQKSPRRSLKPGFIRFQPISHPVQAEERKPESDQPVNNINNLEDHG